MTRPLSFIVREARLSDAPAMAALDRVSFPDALSVHELRLAVASSRAWTWTTVVCVEPPYMPRPWFRPDSPAARVVVGYGLARRSGLDGVEVERLCVSPPWRRLGLGRALAESMRSRADARRPLIVFRPREEWLDAHLWLKALGWRCVRIEDGRYVFAWSRVPVDPSFGTERGAVGC